MQPENVDDAPALSDEQKRVAVEAAYWLGELTDEGSRQLCREPFVRWLTTSPLHVEEFLIACFIDQQVRVLLSKQWQRISRTT